MIPEHLLPGRYNIRPRSGVPPKPEVHERNAALVQKHGGRVVPFCELPRIAQLAIFQYGIVEGREFGGKGVSGLDEAVNQYRTLSFRTKEDALRAWEKTLVPFLLATPGQDVQYGYVRLPLAALTESVMRDDDLAGQTWDEYHKWYMGNGTKHTAPGDNPWAVLLSPFKFETLEDGWTRFHNYAERKIDPVPAVWWPMNPKGET